MGYKMQELHDRAMSTVITNVSTKEKELLQFVYYREVSMKEP